MVVAVLCVAASFERLRRVHRASAFDFGALSGALGRNADALRLAELGQHLRAESATWEGELVADALDARNAEERTARLNERLGDVASDLAWGILIPRTAARVSG